MIVGEGVDPKGDDEAWIAYDEHARASVVPSTATRFGVGLLVVGARRRSGRPVAA